MILGVIVFIAVLAALLVFSLRETIQVNIRDIFTNPSNPFYDFTETVLGIGLLFGGAFIFSLVASFLPQFDWNLIGWLILWFFIGSLILASVIFDFYTTYQDKLITKINIHNKKVQSVKNDLSLVKKYRKEFEKEIQLSHKLTTLLVGNQSSSYAFNEGVFVYVAQDLDLPGTGKVFKKSDFNLYTESEPVLIDDDFKTKANDPILTYQFKCQNNLGVEADYVLLCILREDKQHLFFVLNSEETLFRLDTYKTGYGLIKFKPGPWTIFLIEKMDAFFEEIKTFEQQKKEITLKEAEERKTVEKQKQDQKLRKDFL